MENFDDIWRNAQSKREKQLEQQLDYANLMPFVERTLEMAPKGGSLDPQTKQWPRVSQIVTTASMDDLSGPRSGI